MRASRSTASALALATLTATTSAHTWTEMLSVLGPNGEYTTPAGYPRGFAPRGAGKGADVPMTVLYPPNDASRKGNDQIRVAKTDKVCADRQAPGTQVKGFDVLTAKPGDFVAMRYLENGHVTGPDVQADKPGSGGLTYVYATTNTQANPALLDVMRWTANATLAQGRLLTVQNYDDGRCYQVTNRAATPEQRNLSPERQKQFPNGGGETPCETDIQIPKDAPDGGKVSLYWVWQWPTRAGKTQPTGKDEIYTTCSDVQISSSANAVPASTNSTSQRAASSSSSSATDVSNAGAKYMLPQGTLIKSAPANYKQRAANVTLPASTDFYGPNNPNGMPIPKDQNAPAAAAVPAAPPAAAAAASSSPANASANANAPVTVTVTVTATPTACAGAGAPPTISPRSMRQTTRRVTVTDSVDVTVEASAAAASATPAVDAGAERGPRGPRAAKREYVARWYGDRG